MSLIEFGTIMNLTKGKKPKNQFGEYKAGLMPYVDIKAFETGRIESYTDGEKCLPCKEDDILIVCDGSRSGLVGKALNGYVGSTLAKISAEGLTQDYLYYFLQGQYALLNTKKKGTGTPHLNPELLRKQLIYVPSIEMQQRIVFHIEELFSELDKGVETLQTIKEQLAVYRQAVLKEAFDSAEKDCKMLRIEEMLTKDRKGMSTGPFGTMIKKSDHKTSGVPMLGIENIGAGQFVDGNKIFVTEEKAKELKSFVLKAGDIIISRSGTVGEICAVPERADGALLLTNLMRVSLDANIVRADYFIALFQSKGVVLDQVKELCKGSTRDFLNQTILKQIVFPVPSIEKQSEIIAVIEARFSICDRIEKTVDTALAQAEAMRQSILKKAFEGELCK